MDLCSIMVRELSSSFSLSTALSERAVPSRSLRRMHILFLSSRGRRRLALKERLFVLFDELLLRLQLHHHLLKLQLLLLQDLVEPLQLLKTHNRLLGCF